MKKFWLLLITLTLSACSFPSTPSSTSISSSEAPASSSLISSEQPSSLEVSSSESSDIESSSSEESSLESSSEELSSEELSSEEFSFEDFSLTPDAGGQTEVLVKDAPILHAWDISISQIINNLDNIEKANFKAIQLSPLQPSKSSNSYDPWWNLYQPLGFKVSTGNENPIGNKDQLKNLCQKAKEKDISIIMDVVCNHLSSEDNGARLSDGVRNFEQQIYDQNLIHHYDGGADDNNLESIVRGRIGLVSIDTGNSHVQNRVKQMLKDYIDCGVSGFRFDAAKHIETPDDGNYASNFWPTVTDTIYTYGQEKLGKKPFIYGEILFTPGAGRSWDSYTKYMSLVDNVQGQNVLDAIVSGNAGNANAHVNVGLSNAVLWAESHDTFENKEEKTTHVDTRKLDLTYAVQISRKDATALYFARPKDNYPTDNAPQVTSGMSSNYKSALISAANKLHNDFVGGSEDIRSIDNKVVNVRTNKSGSNTGILIADPNLGSSATLTIPNVPDGEYTNIMNSQKVNIVDGKVTVSLSQGGAVLEKRTSSSTVVGPEISISTKDGKTVFKDTLDVTIEVKDAEEAYYTINNQKVADKFKDKVEFTLPATLSDGTYVIDVFAKNNQGVVTGASLSVVKSDLVNKPAILKNVPGEFAVFGWVWVSDGQGHWVGLTHAGNDWMLEPSSINEENKLIFVLVDSSKQLTAETMDWMHRIRQTGDLDINNQALDYNDSIWR